MIDSYDPHGQMPSPLQGMLKSEIRKLARKGKLVDYTFKVFSREVFPGATPEQVHVMRVCFFAGAAEMFTLMTAGLDDGTAETHGDLEFMNQWVKELSDFHDKTYKAWTARKGKHAH